MLKLDNISKYYSSQETVTQALNKINLSFKNGEFVVITGESGSGKSTLLNVISGLDTYEDGELYINGEETSHYAQEDWEQYRKHYIGFVFQNFNIIDAYTVYQNVYVALTVQGYDKVTRKARALELIDKVGLSSHKNHRASKLSGGQKQRVSIARALAKDAPVIVADEPTGNLDTETGKQIIELLKSISKDKLVIMVTHDYASVKDYASRTVRLFDGEVVEDKTLKQVESKPMIKQKKAYHINPKNLVGIAFRNILSMPKKTIFTLLISLFIVTVFALNYGSYVEQSNALGQTYHPYFNNNTEQRVIVTKVDSQPFTESDLATLNNISGVDALIKTDNILDFEASIRVYNERFDYYYHQMTLFYHADGLRSRDLAEGRLPSNSKEVVIGQRTDFEIGDEIVVNFSDQVFRYGYESDLAGINYTFTVVGISSKNSLQWQEELFLHDSFFNDPLIRTLALKTFHDYRLNNETTNHMMSISSYAVIVSEDAIEGTLGVSQAMLNEWIASLDETQQSTFLNETFNLAVSSSFYGFTEGIDLNIEGFQYEGYEREAILIHPNDYVRLIPQEPYQISLIVYDHFTYQRVNEQLSPNFYNVVYPANYDDGFMAIFNIINNILQGFSSIFLLVVMYFGAYVALKNIMKSKQKDFVIMRSIGASKKDLNRVSILELVLIMMIAFGIVFTFFFINQFISTPVPNYLRFFSVMNYGFMLLALIIMSMLLALRFNKKLYSESVMNALRRE